MKKNQPFAMKTNTEVKLVVDNPGITSTAFGSPYPRTLYNATTHDQCMFHHNSVTRLQHVNAAQRVKVCKKKEPSRLYKHSKKKEKKHHVRLSSVRFQTPSPPYIYYLFIYYLFIYFFSLNKKIK